MKASFYLLLALFAGVLLASVLTCTTGEEPETIVVPVGEPGDSDPYNSGGDLGCGGSTSATLTGGGGMVLLVFEGEADIWFVYLATADFNAVLDALDQADELADFKDMTPRQVDDLHARFCGEPSDRSAADQDLYALVANVLGAKMDEIASDVCD
jgi:hypothetical protein